MAKGKLEFDLDDHGDRLAHKRAVMATDAYLVLHDFDQELRKYTKYSQGIGVGDKIALPLGYHELAEIESCVLHEVISNIRFKFNKIIEDRGVDLDDLD